MKVKLIENTGSSKVRYVRDVEPVESTDTQIGIKGSEPLIVAIDVLAYIGYVFPVSTLHKLRMANPNLGGVTRDLDPCPGFKRASTELVLTRAELLPFFEAVKARSVNRGNVSMAERLKRIATLTERIKKALNLPTEEPLLVSPTAPAPEPPKPEPTPAPKPELNPQLNFSIGGNLPPINPASAFIDDAPEEDADAVSTSRQVPLPENVEHRLAVSHQLGELAAIALTHQFRISGSNLLERAAQTLLNDPNFTIDPTNDPQIPKTKWLTPTQLAKRLNCSTQAIGHASTKLGLRGPRGDGILGLSFWQHGPSRDGQRIVKHWYYNPILESRFASVVKVVPPPKAN